ncbi:MAG: hypothetical protein PF505_06845 [Vallitaleaceae bacterium]|jgi:hypothetical protein|nr:hypothetical protein [Vallitaleaceae bacterium]
MKLYRERNHFSTIGLGLGILGMFMWLIPIAGIVVSIACLIFVSIGLGSRWKTSAYFGLVLGILSLALTILRSALVFYMR